MSLTYQREANLDLGVDFLGLNSRQDADQGDYGTNILESFLMKAHIVKGILPEYRSFMFFRIVNRSYPFAWHYHNHCELFMPIKGAGNCIIGDYTGSFSAGDMILVGENLPHVFYTNPDPSLKEGSNQAYILRFSNCLRDGLTKMFPESAQISSLFDGAQKGIKYSQATAAQIFKKMRQLEEGAPNCDLKSLIIFFEILGILSEAKDSEFLSLSNFTPKVKEEDIARIDRIFAYISRNYLKKLDLVSIAKSSGTSVPNLCRFFRKSTNKSVIDYVNEMRINHACRLISETEKSISEIAFMSGFNALSNFNSRFKKYRKMSPMEYRALFSKQSDT